VEVHAVDEPCPIADLLDADFLTGEHRAEVDLATTAADAAAACDDVGMIVERVVELVEAAPAISSNWCIARSSVQRAGTCVATSTTVTANSCAAKPDEGLPGCGSTGNGTPHGSRRPG